MHQDLYYTTEMVQASISLVTTFMITFKFNLTKSTNHIKNTMEKSNKESIIILSRDLKLHIYICIH